jgi:hypothetical protein
MLDCGRVTDLAHVAGAILVVGLLDRVRERVRVDRVAQGLLGV